jgi:hypothetical protein
MSRIVDHIYWLAFRKAPIRFHMLKDPTDPEKIDPELLESLHEWVRALAPARQDRRAFLQSHILEIQRNISGAIYRRVLLSARYKSITIPWEPRGTSFVYEVTPIWNWIFFRRRIQLMLIGVEMGKQ